ncbi:hypothetical protein BHM03_00039891 [Ensete ventricosum]|nr:hypothetical protein BHM03_00039891 [Ensete ventricosum]
MYVHKPKDTDKHEHFIKHLVYILTVTPRAATAHERGRRAGEDRTRVLGILLLLFSFFLLFLFFFFFPFSRSIDRRRSISPSIDRRQSISPFNRPPTVDFWRNRLVVGGPHTGNLTDRYVLPVPSGLGSGKSSCDFPRSSRVDFDVMTSEGLYDMPERSPGKGSGCEFVLPPKL